MTLLILVAAFFILAALGMPIAYAIGVSSLCAILYQGMPVVLISHYLFAGVDSFILCAVPMFILAGEIMLQGGLTRSLTDFADLLVGRIRGGLGHTNIMASIFFAGITGSATADTAAIGSLLIPAMADRGYSKTYSTGRDHCQFHHRADHPAQPDLCHLRPGRWAASPSAGCSWPESFPAW